MNNKIAEKISDILIDGGKILFAGAVVGNVFENSESQSYIISGGVLSVLFIVVGLLLTYLATKK